MGIFFSFFFCFFLILDCVLLPLLLLLFFSFLSSFRSSSFLFAVVAQVTLQVLGEGGELTGTTKKKLIVNGQHPSIAFFDDIMVSPVGKYRLRVLSTENPDVYVDAAHELSVGASHSR